MGHIDELDADHWAAEMIGGTSKMPKDNRPAPYEKHKAIPNDSGYCRMMLSNGLDCDLYKDNEIHNIEPKPLPANVIRVQAMDDKVAGCLRIEVYGPITDDAKRIVLEVLPPMLEKFLCKNADYGDDPLKLGSRAEFVRIWNKVRKLKSALWDEKELDFEQVDEILDDFLGHILLARSGLGE